MKVIDGKKYYKMSELVEQSGLNNHTIQFYSQKGLLPNTLSPSKNMKYYPHITMTVLNLIIYLKDNCSFSIDYIKALFDYYQVDFQDRSELIVQTIQMLNCEVKEARSKTQLLEYDLEEAIALGVLANKDLYFKTEIEVLKTFDALLHYDVAKELITEYLEAAKKLAKLEKSLANKVLEQQGELPEIVVLDILNRLKPFIFNSQTIEAFKEDA